MNFLFDNEKTIEFDSDFSGNTFEHSKRQYLLVFKCGSFISVIKQNNNLDLYTSQRDNLGIDEEGPDISNASIEQINKTIEDFIETFGLPIEMNHSLI